MWLAFCPMPTNRNVRSVAAAGLALLLTVALLAACPRHEVDHSTAQFDTATVAADIPPPMPHGTTPPDALAERAEALRASRSRTAAVDAQAAADARAILAAAAARPARRRAADTMAMQAGGDFWRRLANCEAHDGTGGNGGGYFQFAPSTARAVGYHAGMTYDQQVLLAQEWARRIHPREGTTSGWPHCWWVALGG